MESGLVSPKVSSSASTLQVPACPCGVDIHCFEIMKKIIAEIIERPNKFLSTMLYCVGEGGQVDRAVTETLLDLIEQSYPHENELESLVTLAESGNYVSPNLSLPDWGVNDTNIWLAPPMAKPGHVCIANENTGDFSTEDGGAPQQFTYEQFRAALRHWREFVCLVKREGKQNLVGMRYEAAFP
jgi:hypothetical protein